MNLNRVRVGILILLGLCAIQVSAQVSLKVSPAYQSAGYELMLGAGVDSDHTSKAIADFQLDGESVWHNTQIPDYNFQQNPVYFRGAIFNLQKGKLYHIKITWTDSFPIIVQKILTDTFRLKMEPALVQNSTLKYVSPNGNGSLYSAANPGDFKTLMQSGLVDCGTTVILKGGTYRTGEIQVNFNQNCTQKTPIQIVAADGETVIMDGGDTTKYIWQKVPGDTHMYYATINANLEFNQLCLMNGERLYPYAFRVPDAIFTTYPCLTKLDYGLSGFYRIGNQTYIKTLDHKNPNNTTVAFSKYFYFMIVNGNNKNSQIVLKGIHFKNYAKGKCDKDIFGNPSACYPGFGLQFNSVNNVTVSNCSFDYCNFALSFNLKSSNNLITDCKFKDGMALWSHGAFKQTRDQSIVNYGSYGRYLEFAAIMLNSGDSVCASNAIQKCTVDGFIGGLLGQISGSIGILKETEIANNKVSWCYNGINADGNTNNTRFIQNEISHCQVGVSAIGASGGPVHMVRNVIRDINDKVNHNNDIFFMDCNNKLSNKIWVTGLKLNAGARTNNPPAFYFYHNTFHAKDSFGFPMYLWASTWKKLTFANNIFYSEGTSSLFLDGIKDDTNFAYNSNSDHYYNSKNNLAIIQPVNGQLPCLSYSDPVAFGTAIKTVTSGKDVYLKNSIVGNPSFVNANAGNFQLQSGSPDIDKGVLLANINDNFLGSGPDVGAFEFGAAFINQKGKRENKIELYPNPANGIVGVNSVLPILELQIFDISGKLLAVKTAVGKQVNLPSRASGMLILRIRTSDGISSHKLMVEANN